MNIGILGGGVWGSALARLLSNNKVTIFSRDSKITDSINNHRFNPKLKYVVFNDNVSAQTNLELLSDMQYIFIALPSQNIREVLSAINLQNKDQEIIIASKGIEIKSGLLLSEVIKETVLTKNISILSGPCFSNEVAQNLPTAVTLGTKNQKNFNAINLLFKKK